MTDYPIVAEGAYNNITEDLIVTLCYKFTGKDETSTCCIFELLQKNNLPDDAFNASSGHLFISNKPNFLKITKDLF